MNLDQLTGRRLRLREELAVAASSMPWNSGHVDRLTIELARVEHDIDRLRGDLPADTGPQQFPFFPLPTGEQAKERR